MRVHQQVSTVDEVVCPFCTAGLTRKPQCKVTGAAQAPALAKTLHPPLNSTPNSSLPRMPLLSKRHREVSATPVIGPLTSGSRTSFRKGDRNSSGCTTDQSATARWQRVWADKSSIAT